ncbi:unnamed protein product, partial [Nesidiocoris tenuis]
MSLCYCFIVSLTSSLIMRLSFSLFHFGFDFEFENEFKFLFHCEFDFEIEFLFHCEFNCEIGNESCYCFIEHDYIQRIVSKIVNLRPNLVIVSKSVARLAQDLLLEAGISLALNVKPTVVERIARATGADILTSVDAHLGAPELGLCKRFQIMNLATESAPVFFTLIGILLFRFVHNGGAVHIKLRHLEKEIPPLGGILMWTWCSHCNKEIVDDIPERAELHIGEEANEPDDKSADNGNESSPENDDDLCQDVSHGLLVAGNLVLISIKRK